jgi:adenylyltransferase/sulfurtransferase
LFPDPPPPGSIPNCAEAGVLGVLPGIIGLLQATEAIKLILGIGEPLLGRLLHFEALGMKFREFKLRRDANCPVCGDSPTITEPIDYEAFCGAGETENGKTLPTISVHDLRRKLEADGSIMIVDVREPFEYEIAHIAGSKLIPLTDLPARFDELERGKEIVALCKTGVRSARAVELLQSAGFTQSFNLEGGIDAWASEIDPTMEKY